MKNYKNFTYQEEYILNDLNESFGSDLLNKLKKYASKGLLTASILLSLFGSVNANNFTQDDFETGIELVDNKESIKVYQYFIGIASELAGIHKKDIEKKAGFIEIAKHYQVLRDGGDVIELSDNAKECMKEIKKMSEKTSDSEKQHFIDVGEKMTRNVSDYYAFK